MKYFKIVMTVVSLLILAIGLAIGVYNYVDHLSCHGCSSHNSHPLIELMCFTPFVLLAGVIFGISMLVDFIVKKRRKNEKNIKNA